MDGWEYFWRVDAVNTGSNIIKGKIWSFTATKFVEILGEWTSGLEHSKEAGYGRQLLFTAHLEGYEVLNSVSYGGQAMTKVIDEIFTASYVVVYRLNETGIANATSDTFTVNWSSEPNLVGYSSGFLSNVNQASPIGASASNSSDPPNEMADTAYEISAGPLATNPGDMVVAVGVTGNDHAYGFRNGFTTGIELLITSADGIAGFKIADGSDETPILCHVQPKQLSIAGFVINYDN